MEVKKNDITTLTGKSIDHLVQHFLTDITYNKGGDQRPLEKTGRHRKAIRVGIKKLNKMKTDFYTKAVLTVIAICLIIIVVKQVDIIPYAYANTSIDNLKNSINYGLVPLNPDGSIDVNIKSASTMDVNIESCSNSAFYYAEPIEVKITN